MARRGPHPLRFAILILPYGMTYGFVSLTLQVLAVRRGVDEATMFAIVTSTYVVHSLKFLWAPLVDGTLTRRAWYLIANLLTGLGVIAAASMPIGPDSLVPLTIVIWAAQVGMTLMGMSCEAFLALAVPTEEKGKASGWYNAAVYAGTGSGWLGLKLAAWLPEGWMVGLVYAAVMLPCALPLIGLDVPRAAEHAPKLGAAMRQLIRDLVGLARSRTGLTGLIIALTPVGAGALQNAFSSVPGRWGIAPPYELDLFGLVLNADDVIGLATGVFGNLLSAAGALLGGMLADRVVRRLGYAATGFTMALCAIAMAILPREPWVFVVFSSVYNLLTGLALAFFTAWVLETIGHGAVVTKYTIFASLANLAIFYTGEADAFALDRGGHTWGTTAMLATDAAFTLAGCTLLVAMFVAMRRRSTSPAA